MERRTIRAWHYTRLTDEEVVHIRRTGVSLATPETTQQRLDRQVAAGAFSAEIADRLFAASPFHNAEQSNARSGKFWMRSTPRGTDSLDVLPLLALWGGEAVHFCLQDHSPLANLVAGIGKPRVIELAAPLDATHCSYQAAKAVIATFGRTLGCPLDKGHFDLYTTRALGPEAVLAVHTEGEVNFAALAQGYPLGFAER